VEAYAEQETRVKAGGKQSSVPPKRQLTLNRLHDVISQKMILFITTGVRTSDPICRPSICVSIRVPGKALVATDMENMLHHLYI
jgi:hypothetical protein